MHPYITATKIDIADASAMVDLSQIRFRNIDSVGTAEHELFCLYQTNKDLETFLNNFLLLDKKSNTGDKLRH